MRVSAVVSDVPLVGTDPLGGPDLVRGLAAAARGRVDAITLSARGWETSSWVLHSFALASYLSLEAAPLQACVRGVALAVRNPVEVAEQIATLDHAWGGRFSVSLTVGEPADLAAHGVVAADGPARFEEALGVVRDMWTKERFAGAGPHFVFDEVQPTLRPSRPGGPPLALEVIDEQGARTAARLGLGVHVLLQDEASRADVVRAFRRLTDAGQVSTELQLDDVSPLTLDALSDLGVDQVDVHLEGGASQDLAAGVLVELGHRLQALR